MLKKEDCFNENLNPDGISKLLSSEFYPTHVWDKVYYCETDDGIWYEAYVTKEMKKFYPVINLNDKEQRNFFKGFTDLNIDDYKEYGQITFFEPSNENEFTFVELTNFFS